MEDEQNTDNPNSKPRKPCSLAQLSSLKFIEADAFVIAIFIVIDSMNVVF